MQLIPYMSRVLVVLRGRACIEFRLAAEEEADDKFLQMLPPEMVALVIY